MTSTFFTVAVEEEGMSTVQFFFTLLFSILGLGVLAVVALVLYGRWKENRRKRFYWPETDRTHAKIAIASLETYRLMNNHMGVKPRAKSNKLWKNDFSLMR